MFEATRALFRRRLPSLSLHYSTGCYIPTRPPRSWYPDQAAIPGPILQSHAHARRRRRRQTTPEQSDHRLRARTCVSPPTQRTRNGPGLHSCRATQVWIRDTSSITRLPYQPRTRHWKQYLPGRRDSSWNPQAKQAGWPVRQPSTHRLTQQHSKGDLFGGATPHIFQG